METLREFKNILLGQKLIIHTDHMNILYGNLSNDRIVRWRLLLEEFGPTYVHVKGVDNVVADALSRMEMEEAPPKHIAYCMANMVRDESVTVPIGTDMVAMAQCFQGTAESELEEFPMLPQLIAKEQAKDRVLQ